MICREKAIVKLDVIGMTVRRIKWSRHCPSASQRLLWITPSKIWRPWASTHETTTSPMKRIVDTARNLHSRNSSQGCSCSHHFYNFYVTLMSQLLSSMLVVKNLSSRFLMNLNHLTLRWRQPFVGGSTCAATVPRLFRTLRTLLFGNRSCLWATMPKFCQTKLIPSSARLELNSQCLPLMHWRIISILLQMYTLNRINWPRQRSVIELSVLVVVKLVVKSVVQSRLLIKWRRRWRKILTWLRREPWVRLGLAQMRAQSRWLTKWRGRWRRTLAWLISKPGMRLAQ